VNLATKNRLARQSQIDRTASTLRRQIIAAMVAVQATPAQVEASVVAARGTTRLARCRRHRPQPRQAAQPVEAGAADAAAAALPLRAAVPLRAALLPQPARQIRPRPARRKRLPRAAPGT
jgi:hypothetical protein